MAEENFPRCPIHGSPILSKDPDDEESFICLTELVASHLSAERARQFTVYGTNNDNENGTGPNVRWIPSIPPPHTSGAALQIEKACRDEYEMTESVGDTVTWMQLVREEVAEAFAEEDPSRLAQELLQVAALCVSWIETIIERDFHEDQKNVT